MRIQAIAILSVLLAAGCGRATPERDDTSQHARGHAVEEAPLPLVGEDTSGLLLKGRITRVASATDAPVVGRHMTIEFAKFCISHATGVRIPYARLSVTTDQDGRFTVPVPSVLGRGSLSYATIRFRPAVRDQSDPTPPPPPPPLPPDNATGPRKPPYPYLSGADRLPRPTEPGAQVPSFKFALRTTGTESGSEVWRRPIRSRPGHRTWRQFDCAWELVTAGR